jgi:ABC-type multidrug transport system fused ATPase/permease subunit
MADEDENDEPEPEPAKKTKGAAPSAAPVQRTSLFADLKPSAWGIASVFALVAVQQGAWLCEPAVFGHLMDAVTDEARTWQDLVRAMPLWVGVFFVNTIAGGFRRVASERVYARMYARLAERLARRAAEDHADSKQTAALSELARDFVSFFEDRVPDAIMDSISLLGAIGALFLYDWRIGVACLGVLGPLFFVGRAYDRNVSALTTELHGLREMNVAVFAESSPAEVLAHFSKIGDLKWRIGTWSAVNFGVLRAALLVVFVVVLYVAIDVDDLTVGAIYSIVTYLWTFVTAIEALPELFESLTAIRDITGRLSGPTSALPPPSEDDE